METSQNTQKCYWNENGKYQNIYNKLYADLVATSGSSETPQGELIRAVSRLYYEYCNDGNCNANDRYEVSDEVSDWDYSNCYANKVSDYYRNFLYLIKEFVPNSSEAVKRVINVIEDNERYTFEGEERQAYIDLTDKVVSWVARNLNAKLEFPYWYEEINLKDNGENYSNIRR